MKSVRIILSADAARRCSPNLRLDYHECENSEDLVRILNEIVRSGFLLEKIISQPDGCFVVLFRRHDFG